MSKIHSRNFYYLSFFLIISISAFCFTGCSRGGGTWVAQTPSNAQSGAFIDSPVEGMQYSTQSWSGYTESSGIFYYQKGETIKFYIGGIYFGKMSATGIMTPLTMEGLDTLTSEDTAVINMSRILLTLDEDRNPGNGITITKQLCNDLAGVNLDLTDPTLDLDTDPNVTKMLEIMTGSDVTAEDQNDLLVSSEDAQIHLENTVNSITAEAEEAQETLENMSPVATISSPSGNVIMVQGQTLSFQGSAFAGKSPYLYAWRFPDGTSSLQSPGSKTFNTLGDFYVTLTVTDSVGRAGVCRRFITVLPQSTQEGNFDPDSIPTVTMLPLDVNSPIRSGTSVNFMAQIYNGDVPLIYNWILGSVPGNSFVSGTEKVECISPRSYIITQGILLNSPGKNTIRLHVKDTNTNGKYPDTHCAGIDFIVN